jgi:hypothetical protein
MMLSNSVGIIASIKDLPEKLRFDANTASAGELKAQELFALANDVPNKSVHHLPAVMVTSQDYMAVMYDNHHSNGSCNGKPNQTETCLVCRADQLIMVDIVVIGQMMTHRSS